MVPYAARLPCALTQLKCLKGIFLPKNSNISRQKLSFVFLQLYWFGLLALLCERCFAKCFGFFSNVGRASSRKRGPKLAHRTVRAPVASSRSAVPFLALRRSFLPCSASPMPYVCESLGRLGILKIHLLQTLLQRRFWWVRAVIEGDSALDTKFISKELIISQRLNDQFDKIIHCVPLKISKGRFRINRRALDIRNDIICLSIGWEERARGKGIGAVEFPLDLIYRLTLIFVEVPIRRSPLKNITSTNFTTLLH